MNDALGNAPRMCLAKPSMEIVLAAVRFVGDDDDVAPVGQQRMLAVFFIGKEFF